jgi:hypothetical protein
MEPPGVTLSARSLLALVLVTVIGCADPGAPTPATTPAGSIEPSAATPTETPAPTSTSTPVPGLFRLVGTEPVIPRSTFENRGAVLPAAVMRARDGTYHAWVLAFGAVPGIQEMHHLGSPDAVAWTEVVDASLADLSEDLGNPGALPGTVLETPGGWAMYYIGTPAPERQAWEMRRATAPGPDGPWTADPEPVLERGAADAWDSAGIDFPAVIQTDAGFVMLYSGLGADREGGSIGRATSPNGAEWVKDDGPVIEPGLCGAFDLRAFEMPRVVVDGDRWVLAYAGYHGALDTRAQVGLAESRDQGRTWRCLWPSNALDVAGLPAGGFVHTLAAFRRGERVALLVEWFAREGTDDWLVEAAELP